MASETCEACGTSIESEDDLEVQSVPVAEEVEDGVPKFGGARIEDVYKCKGCGRPYALKGTS